MNYEVDKSVYQTTLSHENSSLRSFYKADLILGISLGGGVFSGQEPPVNTATVGACEKSAGR
jgi:hypothetical protein